MDPTATLKLLLGVLDLDDSRKPCSDACRGEHDYQQERAWLAAEAYEHATALDAWLISGGFRPTGDEGGEASANAIARASELANAVLSEAHQRVFLENWCECEDCGEMTFAPGDNGDVCAACGEGLCTIDYTDGWTYWTCLPGCLPDSDPFGPYDTMVDAVQAALDSLCD